MPARKPQTPRFVLDGETWGERVQRAYDRQRRLTGRTWRDLSTLIGKAGYGTRSHAQLVKTAQRTTAPTATDQRRIALLLILAMGYEPGAFDLTLEDSGLPGNTLDGLRDRMFPCPTDGPRIPAHAA